MKKTLLMLAALLCCCFALKAQDFTYNGLNYHVTGTTPPTVELTGHTAGFAAQDLVIPSTVDYEGTAYSVTSIGNSAFLNCSGLTGSLTIPNSVTSIGNKAFQNCSGFTGSLTIGNSVERIGERAFLQCSGFNGSLNIGGSVTSIGDNAFYECSGFTGSLNIGSSVESIGEWAFYECSGFTGSLTIPNSVTSIGNFAFAYCSGFNGTLTIGGSVTSIGDYAFYKCSGFTGSLNIPNSVTSIGNLAFAYCSGFNGTLTIGGSVTSIGDNAFYKCSGFTGSLTIPNSVTSIGNFAFAYCSGFNGTLTIGGSVTSIGDNAFYECSGFTGSLTIPNSVTSIGNHAFYDCSGFTGTLTIGNSVVSIGELAFGDTGLAIIIAKPATPPTFGDDALGHYIWQVQSITVPCDCSTAYTGASGWSQFANNIEENFIEFDLTVASTTPQSGSASITQPATCQNNGQVTVTATPAVGYIFANWTENGEVVSTANPYTFTLTADRNLVANFFRQYDFSATCTTGQTLYYRIIDAEQHWVSIVAPNGDNANGWNGFAKPTGDITLPETVEHNGTSYTVKAIGDCSFYSCDGLTGSLTIPNSVTSIEGSAFGRCSGFTGSLTIPNSVTSIGGYAFERCSGFTGSLTIPNSVTSIEVSAFERCSGFTGSLTIGNSVTSIRDYAFGNTHFAQIIAKPTTPPAIHYYFAFSSMQELQSIFVPCGSVDAYKSNWNDFADKIKGGSLDYELTVASSNPDFGSANITQIAACENHQATVTATPAGINRFTGWTENGVVVSTDNPYSFTLTSDRNLVANFVECVKIYETVMSMPSPIDPDAVYVLGYQDGDDYYLHTSGEAAGEMRLTKNPESPIKYSFTQMAFGMSAPILKVLNENNYFAINSDGVFLSSFEVLNPDKNLITIQNGDISSQSAPTYTAYHDGDIIRSHENSSEGNLRLFEVIAKPLYHIAVSATPEGLGTATATCGGEPVESALEGTSITVSATPNEGCKFVNWTENDEVVSTANPYTFTLTADRNLVANFFRQYDFSATCTTGQTLYYRIIDAEQQLVKIVAPNNDDNYLCWNNFTEPTGQIELPETVEHDGTSYTVAEINSYAFYRCVGLTGSLAIPNSVISIGNDAFYNCTGFNGSLTIGNAVTNIGNNAFNQCSGFTGSLDIPNSVTSIGNNAFKKCEGFTGSLTIPNSVTSIGQQAFENCSGFNGSLTIGNAVTSIGATAFNGCTNFTGTLTIGSSVTSIGNYAFFNCSGFTHIIAKPATPPTLGTDVFEGVTGLLSITVPCGKDDDYKTATGWSSFASMIEEDFVYNLTVTSSNPDFGMASITQQATCENPQATASATPNPSYIFTGWTENGVVVSTENPYSFTMTTDRNLVANFTVTGQYDFSAACTTGQTLYYRIIDAEKHWVSIVAPNNDTWDYGWNGFIKPTGNITLPETVTHNDISYTVKEIGICAFSLCDGLTGSLSIPNSVTSIGEQAFNHCSGFTGSLTIPNSVTSIGMGAFNNCSGFTGSLIIGNSVTSIGLSAFQMCSGFTGSLIIGNSVTNIGEKAFELCSNFTGSLNIPNSVTSIGGSAFYGCSGFTGSLIIPNSVAIIGGYAFSDCKGFTGSLTIGSSVTSIGESAFSLCSGFTNIIAKPATPPTLGNNAFLDMSNLQTITVPCGYYLDYYLATWWFSFGDIMVEGFVYDLTVASANNGFGSASITQQPDCSTQAKVTATPNDGYKFVNWTENGEVVSTENPYTFEMTTDHNLVANFTVTGQYDFSAICTTGQTLYYRIIDAEQHLVSIVAPNGDNVNGWDSYTEPTGDIMLPETVVYDGTNYTVTAIGDCAFYECDGLTGSLNIPNSVASIGVSAFEACSGFAGSLTIGNSVTSIGNDAFYLCSGFIGSLIIPNSVKNIGNEAFESCVGFTGSLTIGSSVENIGQDAFWRCNFTNIISKARTAPTLDSEIPDASHKVYIPKNTTSSYQNEWGGHDYTFIEYEREDYHFNGTGNVWNTAANWEENEVPSLPCHNVFINTNCIFNATGSNASVHSVNVATGKTLTIAEGKTLTADLITLEDGAQLVNNGTIICDDLTVKKAIEGYGTGAGGWYLVSSPVATTSLPVGMITDPAENYDLYRFDQTGDSQGREWLNYKAESFGIENQNGYLYACKNDTTIIFHGGFAATGTKELEYDEGEGVDFPGFNLVGNPYPCNATISGTNLRSSNYYYKMNAAGTDLEVVAEPVLAPCTGVFAVAANDQATVTFTQADATANVTRGEKSSLQDIRVELLANGKVIDRAYLNMNSESLSKFRLQDNASEICFYQNKEELAVASTDATRGEMPLNFKAAKNGSYTITVNVENADLNYLHLVDNLTGNDVDLMGSEGDVARNVSTYTFDAKTDDYASRFKLVFGVNDDAASAGSAGDFAYISNGEIIVSNEGRATLQIIDVLGRIVSSEEVNGDCRISTNGMTTGVYVLNLNGMTQKIVVK